MDYRILHSGVDTLDVAFQGAFPVETVEMLDEARKTAEKDDRDVPVALGPAQVPMMLEARGQRGGYRFVLTNGPTGARFSVKASSNVQDWNLFVSVRSLCLLTAGYEGTKKWIEQVLADTGFRVLGASVNRIDFALDILAADFEVDAERFVCTGRPKIRSHWSKAPHRTADENAPRSVMRGRHVESVTVGSMPGRQIIIYDKRRAAIDQQTPYWFNVWGIDRNDPGQQVWRVEIRAGREALEKLLSKTIEGRGYDNVERHMRMFLSSAVEQIRYTAPSGYQANVSRIPEHPIWDTVQTAIADLPLLHASALPEAEALEAVREQRASMAEKLTFGNLINLLVLDGKTDEEIVSEFAAEAERRARRYIESLTQERRNAKLLKARDRATIFFKHLSES